MQEFFDFIQNIDAHLQEAVETYGHWVYGLLMLVLFCETGLIIFSVLPGDSLLFAAGSLAATDTLHTSAVFTLLPLAAFLGDQANYALGWRLGRSVFCTGKFPGLNEQRLKQAEQFFQKHGSKAILFGRFVPVVRSLVPFVAAATHIKYSTFIRYSAAGAWAWAASFLLLGYFFGSLPFVKEHLWLVMMGVVALTLIPTLLGFFRNKK
jgi:membrane-associated protein